MNAQRHRKTVSVHVDARPLAALEAWVDRHGEPRLSLEEAIIQVCVGRLATDRPSTILPGFTTGRDLT